MILFWGIRVALVLALAMVVAYAYGGGSEPAAVWMRVTATGYCPCAICTDGDGITATGRSALGTDGVAVDPSVIGLGSRLDIPGYGAWVLADDTGRLVKGAKIDLRFQRHEIAKKFGVKILRIRVWKSTGE